MAITERYIYENEWRFIEPPPLAFIPSSECSSPLKSTCELRRYPWFCERCQDSRSRIWISPDRVSVSPPVSPPEAKEIDRQTADESTRTVLGNMLRLGMIEDRSDIIQHCLYPATQNSCSNTAIGSHLFSKKSMLMPISQHKTGKWEVASLGEINIIPPDSNDYQHDIQLKPQNIANASVFKGCCHVHDQKFWPLDKADLESVYAQDTLLTLFSLRSAIQGLWRLEKKQMFKEALERVGDIKGARHYKGRHNIPYLTPKGILQRMAYCLQKEEIVHIKYEIPISKNIFLHSAIITKTLGYHNILIIANAFPLGDGMAIVVTISKDHKERFEKWVNMETQQSGNSLESFLSWLLWHDPTNLIFSPSSADLLQKDMENVKQTFYMFTLIRNPYAEIIRDRDISDGRYHYNLFK